MSSIFSFFFKCYLVVLPLYIKNIWKQQNIIIHNINAIEGMAKIDTIIIRAFCDAPPTVKYTIKPIMYKTPKMQREIINIIKYL